MRSLKKLMAISLSSVIFLASAIMVQAETSQETLNKAKNQLNQNEQLINEKEAEKQKTLKELETVQEDLKAVETVMQQNKEKIANLQAKIEETKQQIEKKKEEIVVLEDKVLARKDVMKERLVSLQNTDQTNVVLEVLLNAKDFADFISRATAISLIFDGDKDILEQQQADLEKIEEEKLAIDLKEEELTGQYDQLAASQNDLQQNLAKRQEALSAVQKKFAAVSKEVELAESEKNVVLAQINEADSALKQEQKEAKKNNAGKAASTSKVASVSSKASSSKSTSKSSSNKDVIYVTATAYSHEDTKSDYTALGYNIKKNKNMKLIAVDPSVIPLGSKVWVEGYGEAIAGDTGGAIKGHKIDVLMPSTKKAKAWGRKTVKIKILN
ncbi:MULTISPECIES: 3D domain-containing protein [Niallia]|uniref:3D domain-containing protein n=1 Tax=Niallia hominis TaxID=3133173 RepID=A0ABV1F3G3_9BACI|nr:3D domain-containing protein [Niallia sp. MER TA 168]MCM3361217.1 3D domain-containing protein [Niallia sp. MER TA 168]